MGERATGLDALATHNGGPGTAPAASAREATRQLEGDIAGLREELGTLVGELDHRRHELMDVKLQLRRHAGSVALFGIALVATAAGFVWLGMWRARRDHRFLARAGRLGQAVARMVDRPERVATEPSVPVKILTAAATAAVATVVKKGLERLGRVALESSSGARGGPATWLDRGSRPALSTNGPAGTRDALALSARTPRED